MERDPAHATHVVAWRAADLARWPEAGRRVASGAAAAVTPLWLWQAVSQRAPPPLGDALWRPMPIVPLPGTPGVEITLTGFLGDFRAALLALADAAGMRVTRPMNLVSCTHLLAADVAADATSEKLRRAREPAQAARIAVVNPAWLYDCVRAGRVLPGDAYAGNVPGGALEPAAVLAALRGRPPVDRAPPSPRRAGTPPAIEAGKENAGPGEGAEEAKSGATEAPVAAAAVPPPPPADDVHFSQPASRRLHFSQISDDRPSGESRGVTASELAAARGAAGALAAALAVDTQALAGGKVASRISAGSAEQAVAVEPAAELEVVAPAAQAPAPAKPAADGEPDEAPAAADAPKAARRSTRKRRSDAGAAPPALAPAAAAPAAADRFKQRKTGRPARAAATASQPPVGEERKGRRDAPRRADPEPAAVEAAAASSRPSSARPFFAVGGLHSAEAAAAVASLRRLGASAEGGPAAARWRSRTTHVLEPRLRRSARTLAALAAGAWLLDSGYAAACAAAGRLLPEAPHELVTDPSGRVARRAPAHWRRRAASTGGGAFAGLTVAVLPGLAPDGAGPDKDDVERMLTAGGATVVPAATAVDRGADFVVAPPDAAAGDGRTGALRRAKALLVSPAFVVTWLAQPMADLAPHVLFGGGVAGGLAVRVAARRGSG